MIINLKLLSHPLNWITVLLMLIIAGLFGHFALALAGLSPIGKEQSSSFTQLPAGLSQLTPRQVNS